MLRALIASLLVVANGCAAVHSPIPRSLLGFAFVAPSVPLDATAPLGVSMTRGLAITVGW